jgi:molybdopterin adenylyltransferase
VVKVATIKGRIKAISVSIKKGTRKENVRQAELKEDDGIIGDAHAGSRHRQVSLLSFESITKASAKGTRVLPGDFAENITTEYIDLHLLKVGDKIHFNKVIELEITQLGKKCHTKCEIYKNIGECIMPREGIFARVIKGGLLRVGDEIEVTHD